MNNRSIVFSFLALFFISANAMELAAPSQILSEPNIIILITYALVELNKFDSLLYDLSYNRKQLLVTLKNFATTNKKIHNTIHKLKCNVDEEAFKFNSYLYTKMENHVKAAAFMGTPSALVTLDAYFKKLETEYGKQKAIKKFNKELGAHYRGIISEYQKDGFFAGLMAIGYHSDYEPIGKTIAKFPPSTRKFILNLIADEK